MLIPADSLNFPCLATIQHFAIPEERQGDLYELGQQLREEFTNNVELGDWPISIRFDEMVYLRQLYMRVAERFNWRPTCP